MAASDVETINYEFVPPIPKEEACPPPVPQPITGTQLVDAISMVMNDIIQIKCGAYKTACEIPCKTVFHAKTLPSIKINDYLLRFLQHAKCGEEILIFALIYLDRIGESFSKFSLDSFNVHK